MCLKVTDVQGFPCRTSTVWDSRESNMMGCGRVCVFVRRQVQGAEPQTNLD